MSTRPRSRLKPLVPGRTEKQVTAEVLDAARLFGIELKRRNVGGLTDAASGRYVAFNEAGDADYTGEIPAGPGRPHAIPLYVELKKEGFDPSRARGKERARFERQLAKLREANRRGCVAFWTDNAPLFVLAIRAVLDGGTIEEPGYGGLVIHPRKSTENKS